MEDWSWKAIFYHIYPLGFCHAPLENSNTLEVSHSILKIVEWIPHLITLGITAVYLGPIFESISHGYDTTDYYQVDKRLGTNEDFKQVCSQLHEAGIKVVVDGVFNHVGRRFEPFQQLCKEKQNSPYKDWFSQVRFNEDNPYHDGFSYENWEGHCQLVKLNLRNEEVKAYLYGAVKKWIEEFNIDGIRLDVAYCIEENFLRGLRALTDQLGKEKHQHIWLMGEMIHGDYRRLLQPGLLHAVTNYECYKGIYSSHNDKNYFEINYSMNRLFAKGGLYEGSHLYNFVDNHDVNRIASTLREPRCLPNVYTLLFTMPGIPSIYYGGEWAVTGIKEAGSDEKLRPSIDLKEMQKKEQQGVAHLSHLAQLRKQHPALIKGNYETLVVRNEQLVFVRNSEEERVYIALNLSEQEEKVVVKVPEHTKALIEVLGPKEELLVQQGQCEITLKSFGGRILIEKR